MGGALDCTPPMLIPPRGKLLKNVLENQCVVGSARDAIDIATAGPSSGQIQDGSNSIYLCKLG